MNEKIINVSVTFVMYLYHVVSFVAVKSGN